MDTAAETGGLEETVANEEGAQQIYIRFSVKTVATARRELSQRNSGYLRLLLLFRSVHAIASSSIEAIACRGYQYLILRQHMNGWDVKARILEIIEAFWVEEQQRLPVYLLALWG